MTRHEPNFTDRTSPAALSILTGAMLRLSAIFPSCKCGDEEEMETDDAGEEGGEESGDPPPSICFNPCPGNVGRDYCECTVLNGLGQDTHLYHYGTLCYDSEYNDNSASLQAACLEENWKINPEADPPIRIDDVWDCTYRGPCPPESEPAPTTGEPAECSGWDPAGDINFVGGVYGVDALLLSSVVNDPTLLGKCEEFGASILPSGGFQFPAQRPQPWRTAPRTRPAQRRHPARAQRHASGHV